MDFSK